MSSFAPWIKRFPGVGGSAGGVLVFPHAGGAAASYRPLANILSRNGIDTYLLQYPQRADRLTHPAAATLGDLAAQLYAAGDWSAVAPLHLFGHCLGATVAFEFARLAEADGVEVRRLWASAGQAPSTIAESPALPTTDAGVLADIVDLGGTDPVLLEDEDFVELLLMAVHADYQAQQRYSCDTGIRIGAPIHAVGGDRDHRVSAAQLQRWAGHTDAAFDLSYFDGGHFYLTDHLDDLATLIGGRR